MENGQNRNQEKMYMLTGFWGGGGMVEKAGGIVGCYEEKWEWGGGG